MEDLKGSDLIGKHLVDLGVEYVFGMGGHGNLALLDGIYQYNDELKPIIIHDESVGASAAGGYFRATNKPGVLLVTNGPGMMQAIPGLVEQNMQNNAVVVICGDIPTTQWGYGAEEELDVHQDADQTYLYRGFAKRIYSINNVNQISMTMARAFNTAISGKPGVVLVNVPIDVQGKKISKDLLDQDISRYINNPKTTGSKESINKAVELLSKANNPAIVCGNGAVISRANAEVQELAEILDAPVTTAYLGQAIIAGKHPLYAGRIGGWANHYANEAIRDADVILTVGNRFDEDETGAWEIYNIPPTKLIHVHIDPREIGKIYPTEVGIWGDPKLVLQGIRDEIKKSGKKFDQGAMEKVKKAKDEYYQMISEDRNSSQIPINPHRVLKELKEVFPDNGVQVGRSLCACDYYFHERDNSMFLGFGIGLIGAPMCQAIGFALGMPEKKIISIGGDGGFIIHNSLLATAAEYNIPVTWIVFNNSAYGTVWGLQRDFYGNSIFTEFKYEDGTLYSPDYAKMAESFKVKGFRVENPEELKPALEEAIKYNGPCLVDIVVDREVSSTPPTIGKCGWDDYFPSWG